MALGVLLVVPALTMSLMFASGGGGKNGEDEKKAAGGAVPVNVPAEYQADVSRAGSICPEITPAAIAAQITQESGWQPQAKSPAGAQGIAQFMPATWKTVGRDGDGDGQADIMNPHDAIYSQGTLMCSLAAEMKQLLDSGKVKGEVLSLALAAYNAGSGAVRQYGGIPPYAETQSYVEKITSMASQSQGGGGGDGSRGSTILAVARSKIGKPYVWGAASDDVGYDCSGLVQTAYAAAGVELAHSSASQCTAGSRVSQDQAQPGDLVCWDGHVAVYAGGNTIVEAATEGIPVRETTVYQMAGGPYYVHIN
ncbi:peptidase P60 [Actinomyces viscosus]|uniref:Probable endopeptidase cgR_2070 n=2 Tax=Actinomyces viscosus TaxID=1656 RepID=A0A448PP77_ACTVI|nr:peptidase P60 [Actinomyces viscosus]VEI18427.1 Probable endopeptidase cgR_2070 precursor [Actinomyces viscosus]